MVIKFYLIVYINFLWLLIILLHLLLLKILLLKGQRLRKKSFTLWNKCLGHISKERIERLTKSNILPSLNFNELCTCVDCIKVKFIKINRKCAIGSYELLEIVHSDINGPLTPKFFGDKYFIYLLMTFWIWLYLLG